MAGSKSIEQIEQRMAGLAPGTLRHQTLEAARRFKSTWIELGRMLWSVYREKKFREWGYLTFDAYCAKEVGIRSATAKKLLHSYYFLEKEEPTLLQKISGEPPAQVPHLDSVNLLRLLSRRPELPSDRYRQIRSQVLEKGREATDLRQEVRTLLDSAQPDPAAVRQQRRRSTIRRMVGTLRALRAELSASGFLPASILAEIDRLAKKLEQAIPPEAGAG